MRIFDLSLPMGNFDFEPRAPQITYWDHHDWSRRTSELLGGIPPSEFPDGHMLAMDWVSASTHTGTHMDAPLHYGPTCEGKPSRGIDQVPLEWCFGDGVVLDVRHRTAGEGIIVQDLQDALDRLDYRLRPGMIPLLMTGADKEFFRSHKYLDAHPGMTRESTVWLLDQGVRTIGVDAYGFDKPFHVMAQEFHDHGGDRQRLFPAHRVGREREFLIVEKLGNLDVLPRPVGFKVACFPIKIAKATGAWTRAVAMFED